MPVGKKQIINKFMNSNISIFSIAILLLSLIMVSSCNFSSEKVVGKFAGVIAIPATKSTDVGIIKLYTDSIKEAFEQPILGLPYHDKNKDFSKGQIVEFDVINQQGISVAKKLRVVENSPLSYNSQSSLLRTINLHLEDSDLKDLDYSHSKVHLIENYKGPTANQNYHSFDINYAASDFQSNLSTGSFCVSSNNFNAVFNYYVSLNRGISETDFINGINSGQFEVYFHLSGNTLQPGNCPEIELSAIHNHTFRNY